MMSCFRLPAVLPLSVLMLALFILAGCIRDKPSESEASSPTAPQLEKEGQEADPGEIFRVKFETSKGDFIVEAYSGWAPLGAARFKELVESGFYDGCRFFRIVPGFIVQWGINGDPEVQKKWYDNKIRDDDVLTENFRGTLSFAKSGPNTRTTQLFINYGNNSASLDPQGFAPFAKVIEGMDVVDAINAEYGERPDQGRIQTQGNAYLNKEFPNLDYIIKATILEPGAEKKNATEKKEASEPESPESSKSPESPKSGQSNQSKSESSREVNSNGEKDAASEEKAEKKPEKKEESPKPETIEEIK